MNKIDLHRVIWDKLDELKISTTAGDVMAVVDEVLSYGDRLTKREVEKDMALCKNCGLPEKQHQWHWRFCPHLPFVYEERNIK